MLLCCSFWVGFEPVLCPLHTSDGCHTCKSADVSGCSCFFNIPFSCNSLICGRARLEGSSRGGLKKNKRVLVCVPFSSIPSWTEMKICSSCMWTTQEVTHSQHPHVAGTFAALSAPVAVMEKLKGKKPDWFNKFLALLTHQECAQAAPAAPSLDPLSFLTAPSSCFLSRCLFFLSRFLWGMYCISVPQQTFQLVSLYWVNWWDWL